MKRLRLKNFRSLVDTGDLELRPLTILVGSNSSGKSSFLRFFPLLRQTAESGSRSPLLWCGNLVDFGDFMSAARRHKPILPIGVEFEIDTYSRVPYKHDSVRLSLEIDGKDQTTWLRTCELRDKEDTCHLEFDEKGMLSLLRINKHNFTAELENIAFQSLHQHLIPILAWNYSNTEAELEVNGPLQGLLAKKLAQYADPRTKLATLLRYAERLASCPVADLQMEFEKLPLRRSSEMDKDSMKQIGALVFADQVLNLLHHLRREVDSFASGVTYLGPFRQDPKRYYRHQELSVVQIEPHGENLAMFIRALNEEQVSDLSNFVKKYLGYAVRVRPSGAHVEVFIVEDSGAEFNLIDVGYGLSQVLPIIAQCWATSYGLPLQGRVFSTTVLAIEQPELHLHPAHQARLADMFAGVVAATATARASPMVRSMRGWIDSLEPPLLIVETHSETLVNRLGELVEKKALNPSDVSVLLFEKDSSTGNTSVRQSEFNPDGTLTNWPIGFFSP